MAIPADVLPQKGPTRKQLEEELYLNSKLEKIPMYRPKDETTEEKKSRKKAVKEERKVSFIGTGYELVLGSYIMVDQDYSINVLFNQMNSPDIQIVNAKKLSAVCNLSILA